MSKLHVRQIEKYLTTRLKNSINMNDYSNHKDDNIKHKAFLTRALAAFAVSYLSEVPSEDIASYVTDGYNDGGIDLLYYDKKEKILYLVQTKWHEDGHGSIDLGDALKFIEGVKKILDYDIEGMNDKIKSKFNEIENAVYDVNSKFALVIAYTGQESISKEVNDAIIKYVNEQNNTSDTKNETSELMFFYCLKQSDLHNAIASGVSGDPINIEALLIEWGQIREPHYGVYGQICASDIASWMNAYGSRLFETNLRHFISGSNTNQDIVKTLLDRPKDFWYFNNGITAIANTIAKKPIGGNKSSSGTFECSGFSVVNGAQTVGSINAASKINPDAVSNAMVNIRIIANDNSQSIFSSEVTRYTNTQNAIEKRDFVALDPEQERIRQELYIEGIEYSYKSGSQSSTTNNQFDLTEATIALACSNANVSLAVQAKREISKLWEDISKAPYKQLFNASITGPFIWERVKTFRRIEKILTKEQKNFSKRDALICVHGNRFIQWVTMRRLSSNEQIIFSDIENIIQYTVEQSILDVIRLVQGLFPEAYPASLFKNQKKCKEVASVLTLSNNF